MTEPRTEAGKALVKHIVELRTLRYGQTDQPIIPAIEEQAATEVRRELLAKLRDMDRSPDGDGFDHGWNACRAAVLRLIA